MISQLPKKLLTTPPSSRQEINLKTLQFVVCVGSSLLVSQLTSAASGSSSLQWGRPQIGGPSTKSPGRMPIATSKRNQRVVWDASFMAAVWEDGDSRGVQRASNVDHSVVVERITPTYDVDPPAYDPFEEDDRLAQLPDDPFDEPAEESIPVPDPEDDIDSVEEALEAEIERRRSADDLFGAELDEPIERDALDELDNELGEESNLDRDLDLDPAQPGREELQVPDLDLEFDREDPNEDEDLTPEELEEQRKELEEERRKSEASCRQELADLAEDRISSIDLDIGVTGNAGEDYPFECQVSSGVHQPRQWPQITYTWKAAALCHKPLYFEQVQLERYGHSWGPYMQPIMSGVHFFGTLPVLPYKMGIRTPCECVYTLGYYRPGSCAPYLIEPIPFTWRAALYQGAFVTGTAFTIP